MDALGFSQRRGNGGKGIGVKCVYGEYLHLKKKFGLFGWGEGGVFTQVAIRGNWHFPIKQIKQCRLQS